MQVNAQYAEEHFADLLSAVDSGEEVEISRPGKSTVKLVVSENHVPLTFGATRPRSELFGSMRGQFILADDWDSPEVNAEIAAEFENSRIFPDDPE